MSSFEYRTKGWNACVRLRNARLERGLSLRHVAGVLGISVDTLRKIESVDTIPRLNDFLQLCNLYSLKPSDAIADLEES